MARLLEKYKTQVLPALQKEFGRTNRLSIPKLEKIVVSMGVPLASAIGDAAVRTVGVWQGSCAELVASLVPAGVEVVSAFQNVSAHRLQHLPDPVECDVVVSGAKEARARVSALCALVPGLRALDGGPLANARYVEAWTALLIGLNVWVIWSLTRPGAIRT